MNIIKILGHRNNGQRLRIRDEYKRRFHRVSALKLQK